MTDRQFYMMFQWPTTVFVGFFAGGFLFDRALSVAVAMGWMPPVHLADSVMRAIEPWPVRVAELLFPF